MRLVTLDFETYFCSKGKNRDHPDAGYSLRSMMTQEYVCDPRFKAFGLAVKPYHAPAHWIEGEDIAGELAKWDWPSTAVIGHNLRFDGFILAHHYGVHPAQLIDTMGMAREVFGSSIKSHGLDTVAKVCGLSGKLGDGKALLGMDGVRDPSETQRKALGEYGLVDAELTEAVYDHMRPAFLESEYEWLNAVTRMATIPALALDQSVIAKLIKQEQAALDEKVAAARRYDARLTKSVLRSPKQFGPIWDDIVSTRLLGERAPLKWSQHKNRKTGEYEPAQTYAFAKTDLKFFNQAQALGEMGRAIYAAKLACASNITISRLKRFQLIAELGQRLAVPLNYAGVMSAKGRLSGADNLNMQNMPRVAEDDDGNPIPNLRHALVAPEGFSLVVSDSSGIEFITAMQLSGQFDVLERRAQGADEYALMASDVFGFEVDKKKNPVERTIGKIAVLMLQYMGGAGTYAASLFAQTDGKIIVTDEESKRVIGTYRTRYARVAAFWKELAGILEQMLAGVPAPQFSPAVTWTMPFTPFSSRDESGTITAGFVLPSGKVIRYLDLRRETVTFVDKVTGEKKSRMQITRFDARNPNKRGNLHPGLVLENLCQSLASEVVNPQLLEIRRRYPLMALQVHDEGVFVVPDAHASACRDFCKEVMSRRVPWWPELPINCSADFGKAYGEVK